MYDIYAGSTCVLVLDFLDWDDNPITPTTLQFTIYDKGSGTVKRTGSVNTQGMGTSYEFELLSTDTAMVNSNNSYEVLVLAIHFTYAGYVGVDEHEIKIINQSYL